jgi:hypothetical protein
MKKDKNKQASLPAWKNQVSDYFEEISINTEQKASLKRVLLSTSISEPAPLILSSRFFQSWKSAAFPALVSAIIAASVTFVIVKPVSEDTQDPIAELAQLPGPKIYPPDFDLEGDSQAMREIVYELFADKDYFVSDLPAHLLTEYKPSEGRFFSWDGEPAVSIQMNKTDQVNRSKAGSDPATLFIVKLSEKSKRKFPKDKVTRKVAGQSGKLHKVKVWAEGQYGYAMVQSAAVTDTTP